jgi:hypothetical protein
MSLTVVCLIVMTAGAEAQGKASDETSVKAKKAFREAEDLYKERRYAAAAAKFEQAYALSPSPVVFFNIGRCHEHLGDVGKALRAYRDYLRQSPGATDADAVRSTIANLERRLRERGVQQLLVLAEPTHALVEVDGKLLGTSPASVEIIEGTHRLVVKAEGFETVEQSFSMELQRSMERTVTLRATRSPESLVSTSDAPRETKVSLMPRGKDSKRDGALVATVRRPTRVWTYVAGGVAVASLASAIALGVTAQRTAAGVQTAAIGTAPATAQTAHTMAGVANGAYGLAGAAAVTAVVLFFVEGSR